MIALLLLATFSFAQSSSDGRLEAWRQVAVLSLGGPLHHVQGIDVEDNALWVSSVDAKAGKGYLSRLDLRSGKLLQQVEVQEGRRLHPGGVALDGEFIWVPVAEYDRDGPTSIQRRDKRTLALIDSFLVDDHIGCVAADSDALIGGNWDSRILYRWKRDSTKVSHGNNPQPTRYQDLKMLNGALIGGGILDRDRGAIDWLDPATFNLKRRVLTRRTDRGVLYTNEGFAIRNGRLYLLPEDDPSRLFIFAVPE